MLSGRAYKEEKKVLHYLAEKRILVNGASSGIVVLLLLGSSITLILRFLNEGAYVALCGRDLDALNVLGKLFPTQALVVQCHLEIDSGQNVNCLTVVGYMFSCNAIFGWRKDTA